MLCQEYLIADCIPRPIIPGDKRALNKRVVEALAGECHGMELRGEPKPRSWAYRKAAWAIEDTEQDLGTYRARIWIEEMNGDMKGHGFDLEATCMWNLDRLSRLVWRVSAEFSIPNACPAHDKLRPWCRS